MIRKRIVQKGNRKKIKYVDDNSTLPKGKLRKEIQDIRGDLYDIVADSLKWNSILTDLVRRIWDVIPVEQKDTLDVADKEMIDTFLEAFSNTDTRMDTQMQKEGIGAITKLLEREKLVGELFSKDSNV